MYDLIKDSWGVLALRIIGLGISYFFSFFVVRTLGARGWGIFTLSLTVLQLSSIGGKFGLDMVLLRFTAECKAKNELEILEKIYKKSMLLVIIISMFISLFIYTHAKFLATKFYHKLYLISPFQMISIIILPYVLLEFHSEGIRGFKKVNIYIVLKTSGLYLITVLIFTLGKLINSSIRLPIISFSIAVVALSMTSIYLWLKYLHYYSNSNERNFEKKLNIPYSTFPSMDEISYEKLIKIAIPLLFTNSLLVLLSWTDTIMLGIYKSSVEVGIYNIAMKISMMTSLTLTAVNVVVAPRFAELWSTGKLKELGEVVQRATKLVFFTSFPILVILILFPGFILSIFGKEFILGKSALRLLSLGQVVNSLSGSVGYILIMSGHQNVHWAIVSFIAILNIALNYKLVSVYGMTGAAIASSLSVVVGNVISVIYIKKKLGLRTYLSI